jgi:O-antigen ligase
MVAVPKQSALARPTSLAETIFSGAAGLFFFVVVLKFGTPVILDDKVIPPDSAVAAIYESWQLKWGYWGLALLTVAGLAAMRWRNLDIRWPIFLPLAWLGWQFLSASTTVDRSLTAMTLGHFTACCALFYLGYFAMNGKLWPLWTGLGLALCWLLHNGIEQHFGGLEATRRMMAQMPVPAGLLSSDPAYQRRIASPRIYASFPSADAFAAAIELLLPLTLMLIWTLTPKVRRPIRVVFILILSGCALACMYWTGSKAGWLLISALALFALAKAPVPSKLKWGCVTLVVVIGLVSFALRPAPLNDDKAKVSVTTRFAYWRGAVKITEARPLLGGGPGTFSDLYSAYKRPEDDFAKLCHNDYLEQACDSGLVGGAFFAASAFALFFSLYRYRLHEIRCYSMEIATSLGVLTIALHSGVDYPLYVPALAWPTFFLAGVLIRRNC